MSDSEDDRIDALIEASSLGTTQAKSCRDSVSDEQADEVMCRLAERTKCQ
jgi:hypothetical protein